MANAIAQHERPWQISYVRRLSSAADVSELAVLIVFKKLLPQNLWKWVTMAVFATHFTGSQQAKVTCKHRNFKTRPRESVIENHCKIIRILVTYYSSKGVQTSAADKTRMPYSILTLFYKSSPYTVMAFELRGWAVDNQIGTIRWGRYQQSHLTKQSSYELQYQKPCSQPTNFVGSFIKFVTWLTQFINLLKNISHEDLDSEFQILTFVPLVQHAAMTLKWNISRHSTF